MHFDTSGPTLLRGAFDGDQGWGAAEWRDTAVLLPDHPATLPARAQNVYNCAGCGFTGSGNATLHQVWFR